jgi:hypothetical protein
MSHALDPLLHAYGEADAGPPPEPGTPAHAELAWLLGARAALDRLPREAPPAAALDAVRAAAAGAAALTPLRAAYDEAPPPAAGSPAFAEYALLRTTREALDHLPRPTPPAEVATAILAAARAPAPPAVEAADLLLPLRAAYGEAEAPAPGTPAHAEYALLHTTRQALDRLPAEAPPAAAAAAVMAAASADTLAPLRAAYDEAPPPAAGSPAFAEYALLRTTRVALDRLPRPAPPADALAAVTAAAAGRPATPARRPARAADRAADRAAAPARRALPQRWPALATATLALALFVSVGLWVNGRGDVAPAPEMAAAEEVAPTEQAIPPSADLFAAEIAPEAAPEAAPRDGSQPTAAPARRPAEAGAFAAASPPPPPVPAAPPPAEAAARGERARTAARRTPGVGLVAADQQPVTTATTALAAPGPAPAAAWEAGDDVRLLSLRLQALREQADGLGWDAPPAPLGGGAAGDAATLPGVQAVRAGAAPARVDVRMGPPAGDR